MTTQNKKSAPEFHFEKGMKELEKTVSALEQEGLSLEDSIKLFEKGMKLYQSCTTQLRDAEIHIENVLKPSDTNPGE